MQATKRTPNVLSPTYEGLLNLGWETLSNGNWNEAYRYFENAVAQQESPEALEGMAAAAWWLHDAQATFDARERAYRLYRERGDNASAARMAIWLAIDSLEFRGEPAVADGWLQLAHRLLDGMELVPEHGWLRVWEGHLRFAIDNDTKLLFTLGAEAENIGRSLGVADLEMLAHAFQGFVLVVQGQVDVGMSRLTLVTTAAMAGEISDLNTIATACCYLISACERVRDFDRAAQWCERFKDFLQHRQQTSLLVLCKPQYAGVLAWHGEWLAAELELQAAIQEMLAIRPPLVARSTVSLAELRYRQGNWTEAAALFKKVEHATQSLPGRARLAFEQGDIETALNFIERYLRQLQPENRIDRVPALELLVYIHSMSEDFEQAAQALTELRDITNAVGTLPLRASAALSEGIVRSASRDFKAARQCLEDAIDLFKRSGAFFETAKARIELARVLMALGRTAAARSEIDAARATFQQLGAKYEAERATALLSQLEAQSRNVDNDPIKLTPREVEVLRLIAQGKSNQEIASELVLSVRTVERHISTIYEKLGFSGKAARAAAAAYGFQHHLIAPTNL